MKLIVEVLVVLLARLDGRQPAQGVERVLARDAAGGGLGKRGAVGLVGHLALPIQRLPTSYTSYRTWQPGGSESS